MTHCSGHMLVQSEMTHHYTRKGPNSQTEKLSLQWDCNFSLPSHEKQKTQIYDFQEKEQGKKGKSFKEGKKKKDSHLKQFSTPKWSIESHT